MEKCALEATDTETRNPVAKMRPVLPRSKRATEFMILL
jgi:hypothetical protein